MRKHLIYPFSACLRQALPRLLRPPHRQNQHPHRPEHPGLPRRLPRRGHVPTGALRVHHQRQQDLRGRHPQLQAKTGKPHANPTRLFKFDCKPLPRSPSRHTQATTPQNPTGSTAHAQTWGNSSATDPTTCSTPHNSSPSWAADSSSFRPRTLSTSSTTQPSQSSSSQAHPSIK